MFVWVLKEEGFVAKLSIAQALWINVAAHTGEWMRLFRSFRTNESKVQPDLEKNSEYSIKSTVVALLHELAEGQRFGFGEPWQLTSESLSAVAPILRRFSKDRAYLVIQEIAKDKVTVTDSGHIGQIDAWIKDVEKPVFVRAGTVFKGQGTQSRTNDMGIILEPGKEHPISTFCVHASHGISARRDFLASDVVPRKVEDVILSQSRNQSLIWSAASARRPSVHVSYCTRCGSSQLLRNYEAELVCVVCGNVIPPASPNNSQVLRNWEARSNCFSTRLSDNLAANLEDMARFNQKVEDTLSKMPVDLENQVGIVIIDSAGVLGLEMFDHPDSWRAFSKSIVRNYADILAKDRAGEGLFSLKTERIPEAIKKFRERAERLIETVGFKNKIGETRMLSGELAGEYTTLGSDVIHLILKRKTRA